MCEYCPRGGGPCVVCALVGTPPGESPEVPRGRPHEYLDERDRRIAGETIKATERVYRGMWVYQLTDGRFGVSAHPVDAESLRDSRFASVGTEADAEREIDALLAAG